MMDIASPVDQKEQKSPPETGRGIVKAIILKLTDESSPQLHLPQKHFTSRHQTFSIL
jgi:hypothetical protein